MAIKTYTEQLEEVQAAISAILTGAQSVEFNGRRYIKGDLAVLFEMQKQLMPLATRESSGRKGIRVRGVTPIG